MELDNNDIYLSGYYSTAEQCAPAAATVTDHDLLYRCPSPPITTEFIDCHTPNSPTALQEIFSGVVAAINTNDSPVNRPDRLEAESGRFNGRSEPDLAEEEKKKLRFWTKDEHILFLIGLEMHGKGNWKDIATKLVLTRTPTQVATHAQRYYKYHQNPNSKHCIRNSSRSSIFEITTVDPHLKVRLLAAQPPSPPLSPPPPFTVTNYPPHH